MAGRVPILRHGNVTVWETLAILEYLAETFPENLWPKAKNRKSRGARRFQMHAGFQALRSACPITCGAHLRPLR